MSDKIIVLSDKDQARKRINVFHGSSSNWINMIKELIGNSLDIFNHKELNNIKIILHPNNTIEYIDSGKGIPVEGIASDGRNNYEAIFEKAFAGSKYNNTGATVGQNGIFLFTLAMTCEDIEFFIARPNNNIYNISYHKGDKEKDLKIVGKSNETYSRIIFKLDEDVWSNVNFNYKDICSIAQTQASLGNVKIYIEDKVNNESIEYHYPNGIKDYFNEITSHKSMISDIIYMSKIQEVKLDKGGQNVLDKVDVELLFSYSNDSEDDVQKDFLNTADLLQHGTIQDGIVSGLKNSIHKWLKNNGKYSKNEKNISNDDVLTGLNYVCNVKSLYVEYDNQVKIRTSAQHYKPVLQSIVDNFMELYFIENPMDGEKIATQVLINKRAKEKSDIARKNLKKQLSEKLENNMFSRVEGLTDSKYHDEKSELFIAEGKSAKGSIELSRDPKYHAVYAIRGKIMSCLKASEEAIFSSQVIRDLVKVIGCGVELKSKYNKDLSNFDISNLRYGRIVIASDFDPDGFSIQVLVLTMIYRLMKDLLLKEKVYIAQTPLFVITEIKTDNKFYAFSDKEKDNIVSNMKGKYKVSRIKGLGELNSVDMYNTALNPETRSMMKVTVDDVEKMIEKFEMWMGDDVLPRKEFIEANLYKYLNDEE